MPKFVRKAALDRYPEVAGGRSSADCTHVLLTEEEYNELLRKISVAERDVSEAKHRAERAISDANGRPLKRPNRPHRRPVSGLRPPRASWSKKGRRAPASGL